MGQLEVDGLRIGFERAGEGPPLLLLHGAMCDGRVWRGELERFADEFTVVAWDAPGCGASADVPEDFGLAGYADCVAGLVAGLGLERPHVLGHSFGGGLALELAHRHPAVPRSLVLVGAYAGWAGSLPPDEVRTRLALALRLADAPPATLGPESLPGLVSEDTPAGSVDELARIMAEVRPAGTRAMARALAEADLRDVLAEIAVPTLLLYGDADERAPTPVATALHAAIPGSELVVLAGVGHEVFLEAGRAAEDEVRRFLRSVE